VIRLLGNMSSVDPPIGRCGLTGGTPSSRTIRHRQRLQAGRCCPRTSEPMLPGQSHREPPPGWSGRG